MSISKIVITGGPCAGKTTAMSWIQNQFSKMGYTVLFIPETATELISGGVSPLTCASNLDYQCCQVRLQREKEAVFEQAAKTMPSDKILIVCDRGIMDNKVYMSEDEFREVIRRTGIPEIDMRDNYDAVFHLVTAAKGAPQYYTTENNTARRETPDEAAALDDKLISAWTGHPHLRIIGNNTGFEGKMQRLLSEIASFLGEPQPHEIRRKYLIEYPDIAGLESMPNCSRVEIIQTYLRSADNTQTRIRQRGAGRQYIYSKTETRIIPGSNPIETESRLSQDEYLHLLMQADTSLRQLRKTRYCLTYENQYFEIDIYPFWHDKAILEIAVCSENDIICLPQFFHVIRDITGDPSYSSRSLSAGEQQH